MPRTRTTRQEQWAEDWVLISLSRSGCRCYPPVVVTSKHGMFLTAAAIVALAIATPILLRPKAQPYRIFNRSDGAYRVVVYRTVIPVQMRLGVAYDPPGIVRLYDKAGRILDEKKIDGVSLAKRVEWRSGEVEIPGVAKWRLPT